ncbi:MAG: YbaB/EbfC family nucleoid-associated protein [Actinomycetota bacterium]
MSDFDLSGLLAQAQQMQQQMAEAQEQAAATVVEGVAGGGAVRVELTGGLEARSVTISPDAVAEGDVELLQDLVLAAVRDALGQAVELQSGSMPDLGGMDLGDLGGLGGLLGGN